jgi:hypothetical protein
MSGTISRGRDASRQADTLAAAGAGVTRRRGRGRQVAAGAVVVALAAGAVAAWRAGVFGPGGSPGAAAGGAHPPATATVTRRDLSATTPVTATLGYAGSYTVTGKGGGTLTWLPSAGQVIRQGQAMYKVDNGVPVVLLYGSVPDWRAMSAGVTGADVSQLNHDLVHLGYADSADISALGWDYYSWETRYGVQQLEEHLGVSSPPGSLPLGSVVFEPGALRVSQVTASLGGPAGGPVLNATSTRHVVTISLDASQQTEVKAGDTVTVTLPDGETTPGTVSWVGRVATTSGGSGGSGTSTIPVLVTLTHTEAAGTLDQAPVTVNITTGTVKNALAVPVSALLAQVKGAGEAGGGYAVEVAGAGNTRHLVPVQVGPVFDDTDGLVQVTGALTPGQHVVVPG